MWEHHGKKFVIEQIINHSSDDLRFTFTAPRERSAIF